MNPLDPMDFDALQYNNQGFNTLDKLATSQVVQNMSQQSLQAIQKMQTPTIQGHMPGHVVPAPFQTKENNVQFFLAINNEQQGPYTLTEVEGLLSTGKISHDTLAWATGMSAWGTLQACLQFVKR
jgi:hypothetical protein